VKHNDYWEHFWKTNSIIAKEGIHEKVGRTINGKPISKQDWEMILTDIEQQLELNDKDILLDIAAGSGAIAIPFSKKVKSITAIDYSKTLLSAIEENHGINKIHADVREYRFAENSFSKIVFYFALQHFSEEETVHLFSKIHNWLKPGGICFIGDIPDVDCKFNFFNSIERQNVYFEALSNGNPIIGTWFKKDFIYQLGLFAGFKAVNIIDQPKEYINSHYRFEVKLVK
jgi:cyclopropane fatty-acyl-phospholipid synthase-like methyltransferase